MLRGFLLCLSTYTRLPLRGMTFNDRDARSSLPCLPLVGLLIGACFYALGRLLLPFSSFFRAAMLVILPLLLTGGIHMDGFLDTQDALSSWQDKEKKLAILKDVHIGAFALIRGLMYVVALLAAYYETQPKHLLAVSLGFCLSRSLALVMMFSLPSARGGMLRTLMDGVNKRLAVMLLAIALPLTAAAFVLSLGQTSLPLIFGLPLLHWATRRQLTRHFGGITGDLAGCYVQRVELAVPLLIIIGGLL